MFELGGNPWFWLGVCLLFILVEGISVSAVSLWFAVGALATCFCSFFTSSPLLELIIFVSVSVLTLLCFRQWALSGLKIGHVKTNVDELLGQEGIVIEPISFPDGGRIKVKGLTWRCQSDSHTHYEVGTRVEILRVEGVTLYVE